MISEKQPIASISKRKVKGFSLGFNALDAEMSQMGHYDDDFHQNYYPNVEYVEAYEPTSDNHGKRKFPAVPHVNQVQSTQEVIDANKLKKRFVWPESLHRDFVSAVFDIGLKNSTSKLLVQMLPQTRKINTENLKSHLQKFRIHRDRSKGEYASYYEMSTRQMEERAEAGEECNDMGPGACTEVDMSPKQKSSSSGLALDTDAPGSSSMAAIAETNRQAALEKSYIQEQSMKLKIQIDNITNHISEQSAFSFSLKNSIAKQSKLHAQLVHKLTLLDPALSSTGLSVDGYLIPVEQNLIGIDMSNNSLKTSQRPLDTGMPPICTARAELQIMSEMRSHMDMHRQLLMRKDDQISRHHRGEDMGHYATGGQSGMTHSSAMHGDRDALTHNEEHSQSFSGYGHPQLDCNLLLLNSAVPNPTALDAEMDQRSTRAHTGCQEGTYTDTAKGTYPSNDTTHHAHQALALSLSHPHRGQSPRNSRETSYTREHADYLYNGGPDDSDHTNHHTSSSSSSSNSNSLLHIKSEHGNAKDFQSTNCVPNGHMINYNISLAESHAALCGHEGGSTDGFNGQEGSAHGQAHPQPHSHIHTNPHTHTLQSDLGGLPPPHRTNHLHLITNEGKVMAHSEGLNAADWNWDAEDSLDHNLFSFLLDHNRDRTASE